MRFQSTHPSGVRPAYFCTVPEASLFQSTHPSGVRRSPSCRVLAKCCISIHAPQWGATAEGKPVTHVDNYFNPRTPVGCDSSPYRSSSTSVISIHAPQWGATVLFLRSFWFLSISIHAPQWGATLGSGLNSTIFSISIHAPQWGATVEFLPDDGLAGFQSTHPSGVRLSRRVGRGRARNFNPRTPVGCDRRGTMGRGHSEISIHAPQWGATPRHCESPLN